MSILADLNPAQSEAVTWPLAKPLLILAGAGSGKTRILTRRIAHLLSQGIPSFNILGVTFTNKAAGEMKSRVQQLVKQEVWVSTFHSTCLRILRMDGSAIGIDRNFTIYDEQDQLILIRESLKELNMDEKHIHPKGVRERIQRAKDLLTTPFQYAEKSPDLYEESVAKVYHRYEEKLAKLKACDFGGLIMKTVSLFDRRPDVLKSWQDRFQHILIDEYQDTNHAQYRFVKLLAQARRQITVVGDPDQSIYAWRGADIKNILSFENDYPECGIIRMEQNYRSTSLILDAANELISRNQMRKPKNLWTERKGGEKIGLFEALDEKEEALYVATQVLQNVQEGRTLADQVVFYRIHAQSRILEDVLRRFKIPYKIVGGTRFYDRKEIKDLIAYLRVIAYPHDAVSLKRILNVPARGIGKKALETLEDYARTQQKSLDQTLQEAKQIPSLPPKAVRALAEFYDLLVRLRKDHKDIPVRELLERILEKTRYVEELASEKTVEAQSRIENIEEFFSVIEDFEEAFELSSPNALIGDPERKNLDSRFRGNDNNESVERGTNKPEVISSLQAFLESISLMTDLDAWDAGANVLTLMTLHTAKGLEFPIAYIVGLEEGIFPHVNAYTHSAEDLEEERRLCYVGITRAKDKLHLTYTRERRLYGSKQQNLPSRFLTEIPSALFKSTSPSPDCNRVREDDGPEIEFYREDIKRRILFD